jgi:hypothetical protein
MISETRAAIRTERQSGRQKGEVVHKKADKNGPVASTLPNDLEVAHVNYATDGLNDGEAYWNVFCFRPKTDKAPLVILSGFVSQDDFDLSY